MQTKRFPSPGWFSRRLGSRLLITLAALVTSPIEAWADPFLAGNLAVVSVDTAGAAGSAQAVRVLEFDRTTLNQNPIQTVALTGLTMSNNLGAEGSLDASSGRYLTLTGYNAAVNTADVANTATTGGSGVLRVIGRIDVTTGVPDVTTTTTSYSNASIRAGATEDGTRYYSGGANPSGNFGLRTNTFGSTGPATAVADLNVTALHVINGQLYGSTPTSVFRTNTALPTGTSATTDLVGTGFSEATGFVLLDRSASVAGLDTLYVASQTDGLVKFSFNGTSWGLVGTLGGAYTSITGVVTGTSATLWLTTLDGATAGNQLQRFVDTNPFNDEPTGTFTTLATAATGTVFRGVSIVPEPGSLLLAGAAFIGLVGVAISRYRNGVAVV